jgi:prolyl-tRNA synthetase
MRLSQFYVRTLREEPQEAEAISHKLMIRASVVKKISTGIYAYLPLGLKVLHHIMSVVREELDAIGCSEVLLPALIPSEPWKKTGRWDLYGKEMFRLEDRTQRSFCLGPTHEEVMTELVKHDLKSYRDLPLFVYQIQTKYRDELRPRFGVVRAKEFIMKDLYSFHADLASLEEGYQKVFKAYERIFTRCSINFSPVEADNGAIGGAYSHEFVAKSPIGETACAICCHCSYAANLEAARSYAEEETPMEGELQPFSEVATPDKKTIEEVSIYLKTNPGKVLKTLCYRNSKGKKILAIVAGDDEVNEAKLKKIAGNDIEWSHEDQELMGFVGPVNQSGVLIVADLKATKIINAICGANRVDTHLINVNYPRDWKAQLSGDIRNVRLGDLCPNCRNPLEISIGMEMGHTFVLNDRYTKPLGVQFTSADGKMKPVLMGCYGIGISRMLAALVEQHSDDKGIVWPKAMAPFQVILIPLNPDKENETESAEKTCKELKDKGISCLWDDRNLSPGVKFKDADLIGFPLSVVFGRLFEQGEVEIKIRKTGEVLNCPKENLADSIQRILDEKVA